MEIKYAEAFFIFCFFSVISSVAVAGRFDKTVLMVSTGGLEMAKRSVSALRSTPGYRPDVQPKVRLVKATVPTRIQYKDDKCEEYISLSPFKVNENEMRVPSLEIQDDYSILVHLKKKP